VGRSSWLAESQQFAARVHGVDNHGRYLFAAGVFELIGDLRPSTQKRTAPVPLVARILMGALCGACLCAATNQSLIIGAILGAIGGVIGAFSGYEIRRRLVATLKIKDRFIAVAEDLITIGAACFFISR